VLPVTGDALRRLRRRLGLTQVKLAERVGVTVTSVARWERGERPISEPAALRARLLAEAERTRPPRRRPRGRA
jgi:transcriptional regulator with XRE-family HTH domain